MGKTALYITLKQESWRKDRLKKIVSAILLFSFLRADAQLPLLRVTANKIFFQTADRKPFFWLGDKGCILLIKQKSEEA